MNFSKAEKTINDLVNYNPPPGYYANENLASSFNRGSNFRFAKQQRFVSKEIIGDGPGPGAYNNDKIEKVKKRMMQEAKKKNLPIKSNNNNQSEIKISSIPSIPKKSTTRVYEELAPGILILHEQENHGSNVGPGSYNANYEMGHKKTVAYKINPQSKKKKAPEIEQQIKIPTIAQQIRNERREQNKKAPMKASTVNKNMVSPSDLCLEVIILREKLLRSEQLPPPGYYYNQKYQSSFKQVDYDLQPQYQLMMGKQERFKEEESNKIGPGAYEITEQRQRQGGFISKQDRMRDKSGKNVPGPGAYKVQSQLMGPINPKGNYPPIFGSGNSRFNAKIIQTPGPGSYKINGNQKKKPKYIKVKRAFYQSQFVKKSSQNENENKGLDLLALNAEKSRSSDTSFFRQRQHQSKNHYFSSKVDRFGSDRNQAHSVGPGNYETSNQSIIKGSFNRNQNGYLGGKMCRFEQTKVRPHLSPGAYFVNGERN